MLADLSYIIFVNPDAKKASLSRHLWFSKRKKKTDLDASIVETYFSLGSANKTLLLFRIFKFRIPEASKYLLTLENLFFKNPRPL